MDFGLLKMKKYFLQCYDGTPSKEESAGPLPNRSQASNLDRVPPWPYPPCGHLGIVLPPSLTISWEIVAMLAKVVVVGVRRIVA